MNENSLSDKIEDKKDLNKSKDNSRSKDKKDSKKMSMYDTFFKYKYTESKIKKIYAKPKDEKKDEESLIDLKSNL